MISLAYVSAQSVLLWNTVDSYNANKYCITLNIYSCKYNAVYAHQLHYTYSTLTLFEDLVSLTWNFKFDICFFVFKICVKLQCVLVKAR
jgi:hypothetical protein